MKQDLNILIDYLTCTDAVMITKWQNILASFWHKDDGDLIQSITSDANSITFTTVNADGDTTAHIVDQYQEPTNFPISKITDLATALSGKVATEVGKGLSQENYTTAEKNKLDGLTNYVPPSSEEIAYINGLQDALTTLQENINTVSDAIAQGNPVIIYFKGYRLYKELGNVELYPQTGEEVMGRGDGTLFGGEIIHVTAKTDLPDQGVVTNSDFNFISSTP
ncbi:hypothetical protein [Maribacter sp. ACAM166]|uniref:hypothetical protein n=1 Tax=Maribacter sp. ACAM166 TaxID=2508996 RepID=UPI0010FE08A0|nr:hypothetical protein [Maribacter sp. ACAM166]TLP81348.1 hypothetical protein ES765_04900 [Maribacter sp. ACAM166]